jgi:thiopeptide-type bacteriocin biosynthesis protein
MSTATRSKAGEARAFEAAGFFMLRTPLLPVSALLDWGEDLTDKRGLTGPALDQALAEDRRRLRQRLRRMYDRHEIREALFVASSAVEQMLPTWWEQPDSERGLKVERALVRYGTRMATRPTPFGLFAGFCTGTLAAHTRLELGPIGAAGRLTRLDTDFLITVAGRVAADSDVRRALPCWPNSSLYRAAGQVRYAEARSGQTGRSYELVVVTPDVFLDAALEVAEGGATVADIVQAIRSQDDSLTADEAEAYVFSLLDAQLLVQDVGPSLTGSPVPGALLACSGAVPAMRPLHEGLSAALDDLRAMDRDGIGLSPERYRQVERRLEVVGGGSPEGSRLFHVDMTAPAVACHLGQDLVDEIAGAVEVLRRLTPKDPPEAIDRFRDAFELRYGAREVPLLEALDEDVGIGFASAGDGANRSPLLDDVAFPSDGGDSQVTWGPREAHLLGRLDALRAAGARQWRIDATDLERLGSANPPALSDSFAVLVSLLAEGGGGAEAGDDLRVILTGAFGPTGAKLLGRFCHADPSLSAQVRDYLRQEEGRRPGAVFAEIVHLPPEARTGNVVARPLLRDYEIPYLGDSGQDRQRRIPVDDLFVRVAHGQIRLRSRRLDREVVPRLSSAHSFSHGNTVVYRFLSSLQGQGARKALTWSWGPLEDAPFLPRVVLGRVVLAPARWMLRQADMEPLARLRDGERFAYVQALRARLDLPRHVSVADGDNVLVVDLDNVLSVDAAAQLLADRRNAILVESLGLARPAVQGPDGGFAGEVVIPFLATGPAAPPEPGPSAPLPRLPRAFIPGSEWLSVKLYTGPALVERLLRELVAPALQRLAGDGRLEGWFFIRYGDPDWHLRLRLRGRPDWLLGEALPLVTRLAGGFLDSGLLARMQLDTYERETERYGGDAGILLAERVFQVDSEAALALVGLLSGDGGRDAAWRLALRGADLLLDDAGLAPRDKLQLMAGLAQGFRTEFRADAMLERQLGAKFRRERASLVALRRGTETEGGTGVGDETLAAGERILRQRSQRLVPLMRQLHALAGSGQLLHTVEEVLGSHVHMHVNRLMRSEARAHELVLYDFLARLYESDLRRRDGVRAAAAEALAPGELRT